MLRYLKLLVVIVVTPTHAQTSDGIKEAFEEINQNVLRYNAIAADIAWQASLNPDNPELADRAAIYRRSRLTWQHETCDRLERWRTGHLMNNSQRRQTYLLCRGPRFLVPEAAQVSSLYDQLQAVYSDAKVCVPQAYQTQQIKTEAAILNFLTAVKTDSSDNATVAIAVQLASSWAFEDVCLRGEKDFENVMHGRNEEVLRWTWLMWREAVGPPMRGPYRELVDIENRAATRNGYKDIGECWREELETANLRSDVRRLHGEVRHLYVALHGVVRYFLRRLYGGDVLSERGAIPAHILGDLWGQDWGSLIDLVLPEAKNHDLEQSIRRTNWTAVDMVRRAEDFYASMSLPLMSDRFWRHSVLERDNSSTRCHGTAADMFRDGDYRMLYCAGLSMDDLYVIHHEMGHIQYYMAYERQPAIYREGANSAFQEAIGDSIMLGVMTPQHLHRLGLITDEQLYSIPRTSTDDEYSKHDAKQKNKMFSMYVQDNANVGREEKLHSADYFKQVTSQRYNDKTKHNIIERIYDTDVFDKANDHTGQIDIEIVDDFDRVYINDKLINIGRTRAEDYRNSVNTYITNYNPSKSMEHFMYNPHKKEVKNGEIHGPGKTGERSKAHDVKEKIDETWEIGNIVVTFDEIHLLKQALTAIPKIPFSLLIDEYRWGLFEGTFDEDSYNEEFWKMVYDYQGLTPPAGKRGEKYFDAGAKFHVPDNTPYVRYFLSSFLQNQIYSALCSATVTSRNRASLPPGLPLHRCDIYGSKRAGALLKEMMSYGASVHWREALNILTGESDVTAAALLQYYQPLYPLLTKIIDKHNIPLGW